MNEENVNRFVCYGYATDALKFARFDCEQLLGIREMESMEWFSAVTALVTHYGRPFKRAKRLLPLDASFVPQEFFQLHERLLQARDKAHAHLDGDLTLVQDGDPVHQIRLVKQPDGQHFWCPSRLLSVSRGDLSQISSLIGCLLTRLDRESDALEALFKPAIRSLPAGLYFLSTASPYFLPDRRNDGIDRLDEIGLIKE